MFEMDGIRFRNYEHLKQNYPKLTGEFRLELCLVNLEAVERYGVTRRHKSLYLSKLNS